MERWKYRGSGRSLWLLLGACMLTSLLAAAAVGVYGLQQTVPRGVHIGPWTIGGMTMQQLDRELGHLAEALRRRQVVIESSVGPPVSITIDMAGMGLHSEQLRDDLERVLNGNPYSRAHARWQMRDQAFPLHATVQRSDIDAVVQREWADIQARQPINAQRTITSHDTVQYKEGRSVEHVDVDALERQFSGISQQLLEEALVEMAQHGAAKSQKPIMLKLPMRVIPPSITVDTLKNEGIERKIAEFTTSFARSGAGRVHNIQATADTIQDMILKPGDIFDYGAVVEKTRQNSGYKEAPIILNGKFVPGIGGGICQVSTTLYNAALRSGLEIVERRNHSLPIQYVPLGQDATFSSGYINFRFRNNTGKHLQIRTAVKGKTITIKLFGTLPRNVQYQIRSKVTRTIEPPVKVVRNNHLQPGEERLLQEGKVGYEVITERIKLVDGKAVETETISTDRYQPKPRLVARHTGAAENEQTAPTGPKKQIIEDGVFGPIFE
ncbi:hypothetical protein XYCOK13_28300 [Xylanibacillus composti]|uniref:G5 domain-containing protein n=1 Tax=Xylanibacillus composti TaxID=1572762 RepID=A0A8J4H5P3_9BACL|nr:VanW family protein [Xylanibacillus composti]GIQ70006.1 hypothetical protein XYCOK13_28300 [Xylanibacillus composti]